MGQRGDRKEWPPTSIWERSGPAGRLELVLGPLLGPLPQAIILTAVP
jgi:hypothetical protein